MVTVRISTDITEERRIVIALPPDVPTGRADVVVVVEPENSDVRKPARRSLAHWAEANAEHWGKDLQSSDVESFTGRRL